MLIPSKEERMIFSPSTVNSFGELKRGGLGEIQRNVWFGIADKGNVHEGEAYLKPEKWIIIALYVDLSLVLSP